MRPFIGLVLASLTVGCSPGSSAPSAAREDARPPVYPWIGEEWETDVVIDGPQSDQDAVRSFIYYLRRNEGLDPFGGTNDRYKGRVFWDADVWVFPALALIDPELARKIPEFRLRTAANAQLNFLRSSRDGFADVAQTTWEVDPHLPLRYPWESDANGNDVTEGPTKNEEHVSADVAWGLNLAMDLGLADPEQVYNAGAAIGFYYQERAFHDSEAVEIRNVTSVDEWHAGDNCLYTNAVAQWVGDWFLTQGSDYYWPRNSKGELVAYEGDTEKAYQQAAAALILWPLEREDLVDDPIAFIERFEGKEAPTGPAMSKSMYALIRARYGDADAALQKWRDSWKTYTTDDLQFCEKAGRTDLTYFNTGAAGCLNAVIYGFIGARIVEDASKDHAKIALKNGRWLVFRPNLPREWKRVTFKGMTVMGNKYDVVCEGRTATVTKRAATGQ
jgi:trehalose/maltose hydrolase-like predicted phosphorylase